MNNYTIHCTHEQTMKALKLGAPLFRLYGTGCSDYIDMVIISDTEAYTIPTAEEMCGWLRSKNIKFHFDDFTTLWQIIINSRIVAEGHSEQKELASIDAALNYLIHYKDGKG